MGTNYYMMTQDKEFVKKYFPDDYELTDEPCLGYEIHIGKRSGGWKPLFQAHSDAYNSVKEMLQFITQHSNKLILYNEYLETKTLEEIKDELVNWADHQKKDEIEYHGVEGKIWTPIDHTELSKRDPTIRSAYVHYWNDPEGYNFTDGNFS